FVFFKSASAFDQTPRAFPAAPGELGSTHGHADRDDEAECGADDFAVARVLVGAALEADDRREAWDAVHDGYRKN
ncbi:hypothetical protein VLF92_13365, partial [Pseudomonas chengduensis]